MNPDYLRSEIDRVKASNYFLRLILGAIAAVALMLAVAVSNLVGSEKIVVTPPGYDRAFWVSGERVSTSLLERWAYYVASIGLDATPRNIDYQCEAMQKMASMDAYLTIKNDCERAAAKIKRDGISTSFSVGEMEIDAEKMRVSLPGVLSTYVGGRHTSDVSKMYTAWFRLTRSGRIQLDAFKEVTGDDPFGIKAITGISADGK